MASLIARLRGYTHLRHSDAPLVQAQMLGRTFVVRQGAIREIPDYDDSWLLSCALRSHQVMDIGSNIGQAALIMLMSPMLEQIVLVEANANALTIAAENLIRNGLSGHARFIAAFVGDKDGETVDFWTVGSGAAGSVYRHHAHSADHLNRHSRVNVVTIDSLCAEQGFRPDFIKVDVEGAESDVLAGAHECAARQETRFFVEMHSNQDLTMRENASRVLGWCQTTDYAAWYLKQAVRLSDPAPIETRGRCHLLLQPTEWDYPAWLAGIHQSDPLTSVAFQ